jgi:NTE family protein
MERRNIILFFCFIIFPFINLHAQKVGLVLSGGGAKGLAHIGVIQALEEHNIPVDYITGTSMGAIIGGMYASGYSPEEIEQIVTSKQFPKWANGEIDEKYIYYYKNDDLTPTLFNFNIEMKDSVPKAKLPSSLVSTNLMDLQLMKFFSTSSASAQYNFNNLFVPFRCIATDITNNKEVVFRKGNLAKAIRASMTFPFYYKPIRTDSIIYFDGGMKNNFPSDVMMEDFEPDFIIGSKTAKNAPIPETDDALLQLQNVLLGETNYNIPDSLGHLIDIDVEDFELFNFKKADSIIKRGYLATIRDIDKIENSVTRRISDKELAQRREAYNNKLPGLTFHSIVINGVSNNTKAYIKNYIKNPGKSFTLDNFKKDYFKLLADNTISSIYPLAEYDSIKKSFRLELNIDQESKFKAGIGGNISSGNINQGYAEIQYNHLGKYSKQLFANVYYGRLYSSVKLSGRMDFPSQPEFYFKSSITLNRWDYFNSSSEPFFEDVKPSYFIKNEDFVNLELGFPVKYNRRLRVGLNVGNVHPEYYLKEEFFESDTTDKTKFKYYYPYIALEKNTLNYRQYATEGSLYQLKAYYLRGQETFIPGSSNFLNKKFSDNHEWYNLNASYKTYFDISEHFNLGVSGELNLTNRSFFSNYNATMLTSPAYYPFPHSTTMFMENYIAHNYLAASIHPILMFNDRFHLRSTISGFLPYRDIQQNSVKLPVYDKKFDNHYYLGSLALVYQTVFGPASLSLNYYEKENKNFFFLFNFGFILTNDRALK